MNVSHVEYEQINHRFLVFCTGPALSKPESDLACMDLERKLEVMDEVKKFCESFKICFCSQGAISCATCRAKEILGKL